MGKRGHMCANAILLLVLGKPVLLETDIPTIGEGLDFIDFLTFWLGNGY